LQRGQRTLAGRCGAMLLIGGMILSLGEVIASQEYSYRDLSCKLLVNMLTGDHWLSRDKMLICDQKRLITRCQIPIDSSHRFNCGHFCIITCVPLLTLHARSLLSSRALLLEREYSDRFDRSPSPPNLIRGALCRRFSFSGSGRRNAGKLKLGNIWPAETGERTLPNWVADN